MWTVGQSDVKLIVAFRNFANTPKNISEIVLLSALFQHKGARYYKRLEEGSKATTMYSLWLSAGLL
jgi:hypothetical protein